VVHGGYVEVFWEVFGRYLEMCLGVKFNSSSSSRHRRRNRRCCERSSSSGRSKRTQIQFVGEDDTVYYFYSTFKEPRSNA